MKGLTLSSVQETVSKFFGPVMLSLVFSVFLAARVGYCQSRQNISYVYKRSAAVNFIQQEKGILTVSSTQTAENVGKAIYFAEMNALENILYRGIPGSMQREPLISNEKEANQKHFNFLNQLLEGEDYHSFMTASLLDERTGNRGKFTVTQWVSFDIEALRKHLEKNGIIRKFGL